MADNGLGSAITGGRRLGHDLQQHLEPNIGINLRDVQIHNNEEAHAAAYALNAKAFTHGNHIFFARNHFNPYTSKGKQLLTHEVTHVAQQRMSSYTPVVQRNGGLWDEDERDNRPYACRSSLNWSDGGHWQGSGPEPDCSRDRPVNEDACQNRLNWSDGGHWIGTGQEPDCSNTGTPGIAMRQALEPIGEQFWARWQRNRDRVRGTRETSATDAQALAAMFREAKEDDGTATGRLNTVLTHTAHWLIPGLQTGGGFGDTGFRAEFQDSSIWPSSGNQVGHFLTAVRLGHDPGFLDNWQQRYILDSDEDVETMALRLIVGHEQKADPGFFGTLASLIPLPGRWGFEEQYHSASDADIENFRTGNLDKIKLGTGKGNSMQDLALSYKGYILGKLIADGKLKTPEEIANWIEREVGAVN